jgi:threonine dehydratase
VAFSSGNHAQGIALAARRLAIAATIVMPFDAPEVKRQGTLAAGARIIGYDRERESREEIAERIAAETGATLVPSFHDPDIIEGQGSVGVEIGEQMQALVGGPTERVLIPCGGGGLAAGVALALPQTEIVTAEPEGWDDMARSLVAGRRLPVPADAPPTACDALQTRLVSPLTFAVLLGRARGVAVSEAEIRQAMIFAMRELRLVAEPGGAVALAALLADKTGPGAPRTAVILSGGNVDPGDYARIIGGQAAEVDR